MIEEFLARQSAEGERDSSGQFTISAVDARRKLVQSGLDTAEKGLLRLVQLGVDSLCSSLEIKLLESKVQFWFHGPTCGLLNEPSVGEDLQCAILACVYSGFDYATFSTANATWRFDRKSIESTSPQKCPQGSIKVELGRTLATTFWARLRELAQARSNDFITFLSHLGFCPIPLNLDGALPNTEVRWERGRALELYFLGDSSHAHSGVRDPFPTSRGLLRFGGDDYSSVVHQPDLTWDTIARFEKRGCCPHLGVPEGLNDDSSTSCMGVLYSPLGNHRGGFIDVVSRGVHVGRIPWPFGGHISGVITASDLDLDLSGLALVNNHKITAIQGWLRAEVVLAARKVLNSPHCRPTARLALENLC